VRDERLDGELVWCIRDWYDNREYYVGSRLAARFRICNSKLDRDSIAMVGNGGCRPKAGSLCFAKHNLSLSGYARLCGWGNLCPVGCGVEGPEAVPHHAGSSEFNFPWTSLGSLRISNLQVIALCSYYKT
jgi:hypothetical protein